jgi:hypothetical protein
MDAAPRGGQSSAPQTDFGSAWETTTEPSITIVKESNGAVNKAPEFQ